MRQLTTIAALVVALVTPAAARSRLVVLDRPTLACSDQQALETALTLARLHDGPAFRDHGSYGCMWIDPDDGPLAVGGRVGVGERSGDGAWRWSFLDSAIGRGAVAAPHKRPPVRWPGGGWQSESARIERVRRPKFSGGWSV